MRKLISYLPINLLVNITLPIFILLLGNNIFPELTTTQLTIIATIAWLEASINGCITDQLSDRITQLESKKL